ncbi:MAG: wax ester/triacylglycerol synthase family O-acyltransferase [Solirubrobacteraceae bacterium]|nr:wax ester/triacylglycerol synthase family O-acyltransferase [Solirubrobacteraceae bacterium]
MSASGHGERLSPVDASFLQLESAHAHMHVAWIAILAPADDGARPTIEALRARVSARLAWVPRCRQRLLPSPLGLGAPCWVDDARFDVAAHVVALAEPADAVGPARFAALRDALLSEPLDRERPLWQIALLPRLADGRCAVIGRVHHAMADGAAALQVGLLTLDVEGDDRPATAAHWSAAATPSTLQRALDPLRRSAELCSDAARDVARAVAHPRATADGALRDAGRLVHALSEDLLPRAPGSALNGDLGPRRTLVQHRVALGELRAVSRGAPGTLHDVGLAAIAGALRTLALESGLPAEPLKAMVPVNMRRAHDAATLGNRVSMTSIWLPLQLSTAGARLEHVRRQTARFKARARPQGAQTLIAGFGLLPSALRGSVLRAAASGRFNLTISSVPGPPGTLVMLGAAMQEIYPVIPIAPGQMLSIGTVPYAGQLHVGLYADPDGPAQPTRLAELIDDEVRALRRASDGWRAPSPPLPVVAPVAAGPVGTYENRAAVLSTASRGGRS